MNRLTRRLYLCIATANVGVYSTPPASIDSDADVAQVFKITTLPNPSGYTYLLEGELADFQRFSRAEESGWLIDIAHDICDPHQKRGFLCIQNFNGSATLVNRTDPLCAVTYEYRVAHHVRITKINLRAGKSKTTSGDGLTMRGEVEARDRMCWVTGSPLATGNTNSHVCPKRLGDHQARYIYTEFTGLPAPPGLSIFDPRFGIVLFVVLDKYFDIYELGFRQMTLNQYEAHVFCRAELSYVGMPVAATSPPLHGRLITPPNPGASSNPPPGLFRWHYLQCVIRKFGADDYKNMRNIALYEMPLPMEGNSDGESTDDDGDWPSAIFDRGRALAYGEELERERRSSIANWVTTTKT